MATRRIKGEGTIDRMRDGLFRWRGYVRDPATGENVRKVIKAKTSKELSEKVKRWKTENGIVRRLRVREWSLIWLRSVSKTIKPKTLRDYSEHKKPPNSALRRALHRQCYYLRNSALLVRACSKSHYHHYKKYSGEAVRIF